MNPWVLGAFLAASVLKNQQDKKEADNRRAYEAEKERFSFVPGRENQHGQYVGSPSLVDALMQGGTAGLLMANNVPYDWTKESAPDQPEGTSPEADMSQGYGFAPEGQPGPVHAGPRDTTTGYMDDNYFSPWQQYRKRPVPLVVYSPGAAGTFPPVKF